jgi:hypothetical protein
MNICDRIKDAVNNAARDRMLLSRWKVLGNAVAAGMADEKTIGYLKEALHGAGTIDDQLGALMVVRETGYVDPDILSGIYQCIMQENSLVSSKAVVTLGKIISQLSEDERIKICEQIRNNSWGPLLRQHPIEVAYIIGNSGIRSVENLDVLTRMAKGKAEDFGINSRLYPRSAKEYETRIHVGALAALTQLGWGDIAKPGLEQIARVRKGDAHIANPARLTAIDVLLGMDPNNKVAIDALRAIFSTLPPEKDPGFDVGDSLYLVRKFGIVDKTIVDSLFEIAQKHPMSQGRAEAMKTLSRLPLKDREEVVRVLRRGLDDSDIPQAVALGALVYIGEATTGDIRRNLGGILWWDFVEALWGIGWDSLPQEICSACATSLSISDSVKHELLSLSNARTEEYQESWGAMARLLLGGLNEQDVYRLIGLLEGPDDLSAPRHVAAMVLSAVWLMFGCNQANK